MISDAVLIDRRSRVIGYKITVNNQNKTTPYLPQRIAVFAEANTANQTSLSTAPWEVTNLPDVAARYGWGSPIYTICRILLPKFGGGVSGIPVVIYPQAEVSAAVAKVITITPTGTATASGTHYVRVNGRTSIDGATYAVNIVSGDTPAIISNKVSDAINSVLASPVSCVFSSTAATATAKWKGSTSNEVNISIDTNNTTLGVTYAIATATAGSGIQGANVSISLGLFGSNWNTIVVNSYGDTNGAVLDTFQTFNGTPGNQTGRFVSDVFKPFVCITGCTADNSTPVTDPRLDECTIAIAPAPLSPGFTMEAAANMTAVYAPIAHSTPHLDVAGRDYPDMPVPSDLNIGSMAVYSQRDAMLKKGNSTVDIVAGKYKVMDFVTTYHKAGENPPQFSYVRNLYCVDLNVRFAYLVREVSNVLDHVIANDNDTVLVSGVVKPKQWIQQVIAMAEDLVSKGLIVDSKYTQNTLSVGISTVNPDRFETKFGYKRTGTVRISSTTAEAAFNYGNV